MDKFPKTPFDSSAEAPQSERPALSREEFDDHWKQEEKSWNMRRLMDKKAWKAATSAILHPDDVRGWEPQTRAACAESLGRVFASTGSSAWSYQALPFKREQSESEYRRLASRLPKDDAGRAEGHLRLCAMLMAHQKDTNTTGDLRQLLEKEIDAAEEAYRTDGDAETALLLTNPFRLAPGQALFRFDEEKKAIVPVTIMDIEPGIDGAVIVDDEIYGLQEFNGLLSKGDLMQPDADNVFGGRGMLESVFAPYGVGQEIDVDTTLPLSDRPTHEKMLVIGSNREELEEKYGAAWMSFAARERDIFFLDIRGSGNRVGKGIEYRQLRLFKGK